jgi:DNA-binding winged helix-turn-helix (wHTH) protein
VEATHDGDDEVTGLTDTESGTFAFEKFTLDTARGTVTRRGRELALRPKSYAVLEYLAQRPGTLVSRRELLDQVWGSTVVTGDSVTQCIVEIRKARRR